MDQSETTGTSRSKALIIGGFAIVALLILAGLFLPPVSLGERLGLGGSSAAEPGTEAQAAPAVEESSRGQTIQPEGVALALSSGSAEIAVQSLEAFLAQNSAATPPGTMQAASDVYTVSPTADEVRGQVALPISASVSDLNSLDLYGWDGARWAFMPSQIDTASRQVVSAENALPQAMALMQVEAPDTAAVSAIVHSGEQLPTALLPLVTDVVITGLTLAPDGSLEGEIERQPDGAYDQWVNATNVGPVINQSALSTLLSDGALQQEQIDQLVSLASAGNYAGVDLNYQQVPEQQREQFSTFVGELAAKLHEQGLKLAVTLDPPELVGNTWNTGGQDWAAIGQAADVVHINLPLDPTAHTNGDETDQLVAYATRQIDRQKVRALSSASAVDRVGDALTSLTNENALSNFGKLEFLQGSEEVAPDETIEVALSGTANPLEWDGDSLTYKYSYEKDGQVHEVWLGSEAALSQRLQQAISNNLAGFGLRGLNNVVDGTSYAAAIGSLLGTAEAPQPSGAAIVWTVRNADDSVLASASGNDLTFSWDVGQEAGEYTVNADFAIGEHIAPLDSVNVLVKAAEAEEVADAEETPPEEETSEPEETPATAEFSGTGDGVVNIGANVRTGPGLIYGTLADGADPGTAVDIIGRNADSSWLNIVLPDGREGWIFASLVTINPTFNLSSVDVVEAPAPAARADNTGDQAEDDEQAPAPPPPVAAPPVTNARFELGGQSHTFANPQLMSYAGMNWIKFQHKWGPGDDPSAVAGRIQQAHANGFKVLLSIPGQDTYPDSIDFNGYIEFLRGVAALGPDAIEVWNEENIDFEWPAGSINPASYVNNMLAPAYNAIKGANPNVMVISGAPAPTGFFGGGCSAQGCDDNAYLAGMAAAGAANYMDCVGAHFNAGATPPAQASGHPAGTSHYSWYFQPTMDLYYSALGKPVCFTELGYLSGEDFGGVPSRFSWAGNTSVSEHAQWLAEAVSLAANSGKTRLAIIFNVDFTQYGDDPQAGYAMIRPDGSCPACETLRQVMGR